MSMWNNRPLWSYRFPEKYNQVEYNIKKSTGTQPSTPPVMSEEERQRRLNSNPDNEYDGL